MVVILVNLSIVMLSVTEILLEARHLWLLIELQPSDTNTIPYRLTCQTVLKYRISIRVYCNTAVNFTISMVQAFLQVAADCTTFSVASTHQGS